ncbi:restriction endonuclease subunit S [Aliarcobacter cryaerophilus]|uniref:restriction endonuclease subunit S n=1 Tax=Aliarcobacter cryaerophilus TaxID=28198 RepID=UPI0021B5B71F|nr:restriction endonuclease subunit S [Aliarcobacter cryaerophilus]MCT7531084.1 restriction endonuclease subunit S [Aliarcobacter cryaerophilus]
MAELYSLPDGWEWKKLGDLAKFQSGGTPSRSNKTYWDNGNIPWVKISDITDEMYVTNTEEFITKAGLDNSSAKLFPKNTILYTIFATIGKIGILDIEATTNQAISGIQPKNNVDLFYMYYGLKFITNEVQKVSTGVAQNNINLTKLKEQWFPLPPLEEQKRIVVNLDNLFAKIDKAIALHQKNIDEADIFMASVLNDVFGELEEKYEKKQLNEIIKIIGGGTPSKAKKEYWENGTINWATVRDMNVEKIIKTELSITEIGLKNSSSNIIPKNGIIIATRVGLGKVCYLEDDTAINQDLKGLIPKDDKLNIRYLFNYFKNIEKYIISNGTGATVKGVKVEFIKELEIPLPPQKNQQKVVAYLDEISNKMEKIKQIQKEKMQSLKELKASILDKVFKGEL